MATTWKGEAGKLRRRVLGAVDTRMKKKAGESDLGRLYTGDNPILFRRWHSGLKTGAVARENRARNQAVMYAAALDVTLDDAQARIARQMERAEASGVPFLPGKGYTVA